MSNYKRLIDEAMKTASYRLNAGIDKTASVSTESSLVKEASELANALEYMSMTSANDGSVAGDARAEMIRDFHKAATAQRLGVKLAGDVGESSTSVSGVQAQAPEHGKTRLSAKKDKAGNPLVSASPDAKGNALLESYKQADSGNKTLYDILMHQKEAGDVGEMSASDPAPGIPSSNENSNRSILNDSSILAGVSKQEAKAPVRARLAEAFAGTSDTLGDQTVRALFPQAYQGGGLKKVAEAEGEDDSKKKMSNKQKAALAVGATALLGGVGYKGKKYLDSIGDSIGDSVSEGLSDLGKEVKRKTKAAPAPSDPPLKRAQKIPIKQGEPIPLKPGKDSIQKEASNAAYRLRRMLE